MTNFGWRACMIGVLVITAMSIEVEVATTKGWCTEGKEVLDLIEVVTSYAMIDIVRQSGIFLRGCWYKS